MHITAGASPRSGLELGDMPISLLAEVVPEINWNPVVFTEVGDGQGSVLLANTFGAWLASDLHKFTFKEHTKQLNSIEVEAMAKSHVD